MQKKDQLLAFWVGPYSQSHAHHFYSFQADQIFEEAQDPLDQDSIWQRSSSLNIPNMLVYDAEIPRLSQIREVNHKKLIKQLQKTQNSSYFKVEGKGEVEEKSEKSYLFDNWSDSEKHYVLIDRDFNTQEDSFQYWQDLFTKRVEQYEDPIRKRLERIDYLKIFTAVSDESRAGFTHQILHYLADECPKKEIIFTNIASNPNQLNTSLPILAEIATKVDLFNTIDYAMPRYPNFSNSSIEQECAPVFNSMYTPFLLKQSMPNQLIQSIVFPHRNIFNLGFTLPIITSDSKLSLKTDIFSYLAEYNWPKKSESEFPQNLVSFANQSYLSPFASGPKHLAEKWEKIAYETYGLLAESYVLKGVSEGIIKQFQPRTQLLSMKILDGINCNHSKNNLQYSQVYHPEYEVKVQNYPFHSVMFQHKSFGSGMRNMLLEKKKVGWHEMNEEWEERVRVISDLYCEKQEEDEG